MIVGNLIVVLQRTFHSLFVQELKSREFEFENDERQQRLILLQSCRCFCRKFEMISGSTLFGVIGEASSTVVASQMIRSSIILGANI